MKKHVLGSVFAYMTKTIVTCDPVCEKVYYSLSKLSTLINLLMGLTYHFLITPSHRAMFRLGQSPVQQH